MAHTITTVCLFTFWTHIGTGKLLLAEESKALSGFKHKPALLCQMPAELQQNIVRLNFFLVFFWTHARPIPIFFLNP